MKISPSLLLVIFGVAGLLGGAAMLGMVALGAMLIFVSLCAGVAGLLRDDGQVAPQTKATLAAVLERARNAA